ncbi:uncharacterized protein At1g28695 [Eucalyptus grandis]|uniref:uncharacterized protein At1g28695 n=1 Tax=Eucalyptus grandis TaxID=71139 RepID=UPI00192EE280|nr:uncharacterized protein At1g28695 [Eucalyptus grandis]
MSNGLMKVIRWSRELIANGFKVKSLCKESSPKLQTHQEKLHLSRTRNRARMDHSKNSVLSLTVLSLLSSAVILLCFLSATRFPRPCPAPNPASVHAPADGLGSALARAAMPDKTLIIAVVNGAYAEQGVESDKTMLGLFLESFWLGEGTRGLLDHVLVVAVDEAAHRRCLFQRLHCYRLETEGVDFGGEAVYMSKGFVRMMWARTQFLTEVLRRGYSFIFTDTDVMWLRNPFARLSRNQSVDLQISTDLFNGDPRPEKNLINTGFYFVRSNNKTVALFEAWYAQKDNATGKKEQDVLQDLAREGAFGELGLNVRFLDTRYFSGFCQDSKDIRAVCTVHANCCRSIGAKTLDLTAVLQDWKRFRQSDKEENAAVGGVNGTAAPYRWSDHVGCSKSWKRVGNSTLIS